MFATLVPLSFPRIIKTNRVSHCVESYTILKMMWKKQRLGLWWKEYKSIHHLALGWGFPEEDGHTVSFSGSLGISCWIQRGHKKKPVQCKRPFFQYHNCFQYFFSEIIHFFIHFFPSPHISICFKSFPWTKARSRMHVPHVTLLAPSGCCNLDEKQKWSFNWNLKKGKVLGVRIFPNLRFVFFFIFFWRCLCFFWWFCCTELATQSMSPRNRRPSARNVGAWRVSPALDVLRCGVLEILPVLDEFDIEKWSWCR